MLIFKNLKINLYQKVIIIVLFICSFAILLFGSFTFLQYQTSSKKEKEIFLNNLRDSQYEKLTQYFQSLDAAVLSESNSLDTKVKSQNLINSFEEIRINDVQREKAKKMLKIFYTQYFKPRFNNEFENKGELNTFIQQSVSFKRNIDKTLFLQNSFLNEPNHPIGFKEKIFKINDGSKYSQITHPEAHPHYLKFLQRYDFKNVLIVEKNDLNIVYSVSKETDFATSLLDGPYANTSLAKMVKKIADDYRLDAFREPVTYFTDFERYAPAYFAPAAFVGAPIFNNNNIFIGVLVAQIKANNLNQVLANNYQWNKTGLGLTGHSYIVGKDKIIKSDLREYVQNKDNFLDKVKDQVDKKSFNQLKNNTLSNLLFKIDNEAVAFALQNKEGLIEHKNFLGQNVLSSYTSFNFKGLSYALITEMQTKELFQESRNLFITISSGTLLALILAIVLATYLILNLLKPLRSLFEVSEKVKSGQYQERAPVETKDEIGELAKSFNSMIHSVESDIERKEKDKLIFQDLKEQADQLKEEADRANQTKSAFLANMSHELRTPMNAIIGYSEMLTEEAMDDGQDAYVGDLKKINSAGKHLLSLINDVLDISKIEAGKMELDIHEMQLEELVQEVADTSDALVKKNNNALEIEKGDQVNTIQNDSVKLKQILFNLISNASKFTENGKIFLGYKLDDTDNKTLNLYVRDTGIGIDQDKIGKVFEEFGQEDASTTRKYGGTGLGLSLCKKFAELMGGTIKLDSEKGVGSVFTVIVPVNIVKAENKS